MKVLSKLKSEPGIWMAEAAKPGIKHDEVLIKIKKTAICGTDLHIYNWDDWAQKTIPVPMHVGHEYIGEIVDLGKDVKGFKIGDRVSGEGHLACGHCRNCRCGRKHLCIQTEGVGVTRPGAFAEYLALPAHNAFKIPDNISDDIVSIFDPLGNSVHTALSFSLTGEDVLITGAGPVGLFAVAIARFSGAKNIVITDINQYRLDIAMKLGATRAVNLSGLSQPHSGLDPKLDPKSDPKLASGSRESLEMLKQVMSELSITEGFDVGMEMSGNQFAFHDMLSTMNHAGNIAFLGIPAKPYAIDWSELVFKGITVKGIYGREMFDTWYKMVSMIQSGLDVSAVITHHFPVDKYLDGFELMRSGMCGKVILDWQ